MRSVIILLFALMSAHADDTKIISKMKSDDKDSSVFIQKKSGVRLENDFEVVSGEEEIQSEPIAGTKESYANWKSACNDFKKEFRENNKDNSIIQLSCGSPKMETDGTGSGQYTHRSVAKFKIKVRTRDAAK